MQIEFHLEMHKEININAYRHMEHHVIHFEKSKINFIYKEPFKY